MELKRAARRSSQAVAAMYRINSQITNIVHSKPAMEVKCAARRRSQATNPFTTPELRRIRARLLEIVFEATLRRFVKTVQRFARKKAKIFFKVMSRGGPFAHQLEIPKKFLEKHAHWFTEYVTFEIPNRDRKWPMKISVQHIHETGKEHVFAYACINEWKAFAEENDVKVGDLVIFHLVGFSRFIVHIHSRHEAPVGEPHNEDIPDIVNPARNNDDDLNELVITPPFQQLSIATAAADPSIVGPTEIKHAACGHALRCPLFVKTMGHSEIVNPGEEEISLDVPAKFWEVHGHLLPGDGLQLQGPKNSIMRVQSRRSLDALGPRVRLEAGWKAFSEANNLKTGDTLLFSLVGPSFFKVEVLDLYE